MAEVLITLGIIGIVAAMTLPSLMAKYRKQEASARIKKFYSMMHQAIRLSELENGDALEWSMVGEVIKDEEGNTDTEAQKEAEEAFWNRYLAKYIKTVGTKDSTYRDYYKKKYLIDSSSIELMNGSCIDFIYDVNGDSNPNEEGVDKFRFLLCSSKDNSVYHKNTKNAFGTYDQRDIDSRDDALSLCKDRPAFCSVLLEYDNWEFKDDYPHKL